MSQMKLEIVGVSEVSTSHQGILVNHGEDCQSVAELRCVGQGKMMIQDVYMQMGMTGIPVGLFQKKKKKSNNKEKNPEGCESCQTEIIPLLYPAGEIREVTIPLYDGQMSGTLRWSLPVHCLLVLLSWFHRGVH